MQVIDTLVEEHVYIKKILDVLERTMDSLEQGESIENSGMDEILELLKDLVEKIHHGKEEQVLFPFMKKYGYNEESPPIKLLLEEHDMGRKYVGTIESTVFNHDQNSSRITESVRQYVPLMRKHIIKEGALFKAWGKMVASEDQELLQKRCEELERTAAKPGRKNECFAEAERLWVSISS